MSSVFSTRSLTPKSCSVDDCGKKVDARGLCHNHYERWRKYGTLVPLPRKTKSKSASYCTLEGCTNLATKTKLCNMHYLRKYRTGSVGEPEIRKTVKHTTLCSAEGCSRPVTAIEWCSRHYILTRRNGPDKGKYADQLLSYNRSRRAKRLSVESEPYTAASIVELYGSDCHLCLDPIDMEAPRHAGSGLGWELGLHLDHVIPLNSGGSDLIENIRPSHAICNLKKAKKPI